MKYKIGDKVKIREDLEIDKSYYMEDSNIKDSIEEEMLNYKGKIATIKCYRGGEYYINLDDEYWGWTDEMFENESIKKENKLSYLNEIIKSDNNKVHIHKVLPYSFNSVVTDNKGNKLEEQVRYQDGNTYKVIYNGLVTIVILKDGSKGIAKCNEVDVYSTQIGHDIAYYRARIKSSEKKIKQLSSGKIEKINYKKLI